MSIDFKSSFSRLRSSAAIALMVAATTCPLNARAQSVTETGDVRDWWGSYVVGYNSAGTLVIANGGAHSTTQGAYLGYNWGAEGTVEVTGANSLFGVNGSLNIGRYGNASLTIANGGRVNSQAGYIALDAGVEGRVLVTGAGSLWDNSGSLSVGGGYAFGFLTIEDGGRVNSASASIGDSMWSTGMATVTGAGSLWGNSGDFYIGNNEAGTLTVANGGTVSVGTYAGGTSGVVRMAWNHWTTSATLNFGAASGAAATAAGTLLANEIRFGLGTGTIVFNHTGLPDGSDLQFGAAVKGRGTILHESGTTILSGDSSAFTGTTSVSGGRLIVANKLGGSAVVGNGATLGGTGTIGSGSASTVTLQSGSVLAVGSSVGTLTVNGNLSVESGARYEVKVAPDGGQGDLVAVTGTATLGGGTIAHVGVTGSYRPTATYTILSAAGGVTGTFAGVTSDFAFLDPELSYAGGSVLMKLTRNDISFGDVARTRNQAALAGGLDGAGFGNPVYDAVVQLDADAARTAFDALSGELHASVAVAFVDTSAQLRDAIGSRLRSAFGDVAAPDLPVMGFGEDGLKPVPADTDRIVVWGQALGSWARVDGNGNAAGIDNSNGGLVAGADTVVGNDWRLGLLAGYSRTGFETDGRASSGDSDNFHLGVYGGGHFGVVTLRAGATYTRHAIDITRTVSFPGLSETLEADYDAGTAQAFVEAGYRADVGRVTFEPYAGLAYARASIEGFAESGGEAALTSAGKSFDSATSTLGLRAATGFNLGNAKATLRAGLGWRHAFGDVEPSLTVGFAGGERFTVHGVPIARDALLVEAGLDVAVSASANFGLTYTGRVADSARYHGARATLAVKF